MLTYLQLDSHRRTIARIHQYEQLLETYAGAKASRLDGMPRSSSQDPHRVEEKLLQAEHAREELPRLRAVAEAYEPTVIQAIREICGSDLKLALVFRMRFLSDHEWDEIEHLLRVKNPETMVREALLKAYHEEE